MMPHTLNIDINANEGGMYDIFKRLDYHNQTHIYSRAYLY